MAIGIKFTKFDNTPWGFRLAGGSDFPQPLTVIRITEGSLAECMGLKVGDVVVRLNDQPVSSLTHGQAHEALLHAGNNFVLGIQRETETQEVIEAILEENIVPYKIALADLPPLFPEQILQEEIVIEQYEVETVGETTSTEEQDMLEKDKFVEEKPMDADSEIVLNKNLTDDEIAQLILEEEELLSDEGLLGVNFKKLRPRASILKGSKVLEELQHIATAEPERVQELKRTSTFLQKPQRPMPTPKQQRKGEDEDQNEVYKVIIKKQDKKTVIERLVEKGLLPPGSEIARTSEPSTETTISVATLESAYTAQQEARSDSHPVSKVEEEKYDIEADVEEKSECEFEEEKYHCTKPSTVGITQDETSAEEDPNVSEKQTTDTAKVDSDKIKELVTTEIRLEQQLENVQRQLLALRQVPNEIENHLRIVSEQLNKIMELSGVRTLENENGQQCCEDRSEDNTEEREDRERVEEEGDTDEEDEEFTETYDYIEEIACLERKTSSRSTPRAIEFDDDKEETDEEEIESKEMDGVISMKSADEEGNRVKKYIVSYETKLLKSPSQTSLHGSFQPDAKLSPKEQVIQELQQRVQKKSQKHSQDLWPQAKQLELTHGRRWRCPNDFFNDEMIAEVLSSQAEVIRGKALGVNFKKYEKTNLPNYDHLMNSSVYKIIHKVEQEPRKGIPARPAKVNAAEEIIERVKSPVSSVLDK